MDKAKALHTLLDAAKLTDLLADLIKPQAAEMLSSEGTQALKVLVSQIKEMILVSHDTLATVSDTKSRLKAELDSMVKGIQSANSGKGEIEGEASIQLRSDDPNATLPKPEASMAKYSRNELRASLEKIIERR